MKRDYHLDITCNPHVNVGIKDFAGDYMQRIECIMNTGDYNSEFNVAKNLTELNNSR